ncbi:hypothetical protein NQ317_008654 [Molorchus minor]|uniref:Phosphatidylinositol-glycan biosynthesis class X protein n=1 Tax=Molorchus minor TaxID=1323400 RepID=A0ABQ9K1H2_9CUCU|nr:hypothetical protein NQ317_008654 [Molorchus minor]
MTLSQKNVLDQISSTLSILLHLLSDIENAVTFARLRTLHYSILKITELESIIQTILKYYSSSQLIFPLNSSNTHLYYDLLEVEAYYSDTKIVFVIHFPLVYPETYSHYHLYSIPTRNCTTILPKDTYLVMNENFYQYASIPCIKLHPDYYCPDDNLIHGTKNEDCIFQLLQLKSTQGSCLQTPVKIEKNVIQQIDESHYIAVFPNQTKIYHSIADSRRMIPVSSTKKSITEGQPMLLPELNIYSHKLPVSAIDEIKIDNVQLDEIHKIQNEQRKLEPIKLKYENHPWFNNYWIIPIYVIFALVGIYFSQNFIRRKTNANQTTSSDQPQPAPRPFFSP